MLLFRGTEGNQRRTGQPFTNMADPARCPGTGILFKENDLLFDGAAATAELPGPADAGPAALGQFLFPLLAELADTYQVPFNPNRDQRRPPETRREHSYSTYGNVFRMANLVAGLEGLVGDLEEHALLGIDGLRLSR